MTSLARRDAITMIALVAAAAAVMIAWGERIGVNGGQGWDGQSYVAWARDFPGAMRAGITMYQSQRVAPSALIYYVLGGLGIARTVSNVLLAFQVLDAAALVGSGVALIRIARTLAWSRAAAWAAFAATFLSFAIARQALYYPDLTDPSAFALGMVFVWAYIERRPIATAGVALVAAFTWPVLLWPALVGFIAPRPPEPLAPVAQRWLAPAALVAAAAAAALAVAWFAVYWRLPGLDNFRRVAHLEWLPVTIACAGAVAGGATWAFAREGRAWALVAYARSLWGWRTLIACAVAAAIVLAAHAWSARVGTAGPGATFKFFLGFVAAGAIHGPLWGPVGQLVYWGAIVIVAILAWRRVATVVAEWGPAAVLAFAMVIMMALSPEGRHLTHLMPFAIVATIQATNARWTPRRTLVFAAAAAVWSKLWLRLGYDTPGDPFTFPDQRYTMHFGEYANDTTFVAHLAAAAVTTLVLATALRERPS